MSRVPLCPLVRYVIHERVEDYLRLGWIALAPLGRWSILMGWPCQCKPAEMQAHGVRIDTDAAERNRDLLFGKRDTLLAELSEKLEVRVGMDELHKDSWLASTFERVGIAYPLTETGKPSFKGGNTGWMTRHEHWLPTLVSKIERYHEAGYKFLQTYILDHVVNGRIHASAHPHRSSGDGQGKNRGAKSFRFSYTEPPLQQMTGRDKEITPLIRGCFLPEEGQVWAKLDASQQEFRLVVHYACVHGLTGAEGARDEYINNPKADFHQYAANTTGLDRDSGKKFNFSKIYGAGIKRLAADMGKPLGETQQLLDQYNAKMPFIGQLDRLCQNLANTKGQLEVYGGGRRHFIRFAPYGKWTKGAGPCERDEALDRVRNPDHPWYRQNLTRAKTYTALNALIQSSAAVHTKRWMAAVWREGHRCTLLQMHDCLDCSVSSKDEAEAIARLGEEAVSLAVPMLIDRQYGRSWADAKHSWENLHSTEPPVAAPPVQPAPNPDSAGIPFMITTAMKVELRAKGYSDEAIANMTPAQAHVACESATPSPAPPPPRHSSPPIAPSQTHTNGSGSRTNGARLHGGSRTAEELEQNAYSAEHADDPYDDSHLIRQGYALKQAYSYTLPDSTELYQNVRYELKPGIAETKKRRRKAFLIRRKVNGLWVFGAGERRVPYNWPSIMRAGPGNDVFVCEGEGNADALISRGFLATTVLAHKWGPECVAALTGMDAIILEDHDAHGERNASGAQAALESSAASTRVVPYRHLWAKLPEKNRTTPPRPHEDIKNWLEDRGGDPARLMEICREIPVKGSIPKPANIRAWAGKQPPVPEYTVPDRYPAEQLGLFSGEGAEGKSTLIQQLCTAHVLGQSWLGAQPRQGPAIYLECEDSENILWWRLAPLAEYYGVSIEAFADAGLHLYSLIETDTILAATNKRGIVEPTKAYQWLYELAGDIKPVQIGIASVGNVFAGNENIRTEVQQFCKLMTRITMVTKGSIVLATHPSLTGINSSNLSHEGLSGTTQWHNAVRARAVMKRFKPKNKDDEGSEIDSGLRSISFHKNQYGPAVASCTVKWEDGVFRPVAGTTKTAGERGTAARELTIELLARFARQNRTVSISANPTNYAPRLFAETPEAETAGLEGKDFKQAIERLLRDDIVENAETGRSGKRRHCLQLKDGKGKAKP
jgi:RecA-family ATPase